MVITPGLRIPLTDWMCRSRAMTSPKGGACCRGEWHNRSCLAPQGLGRQPGVCSSCPHDTTACSLCNEDERVAVLWAASCKGTFRYSGPKAGQGKNSEDHFFLLCCITSCAVGIWFMMEFSDSNFVQLKIHMYSI